MLDLTMHCRCHCECMLEHGSACDPVIVPVFKTGGRQANPVAGGFDPHSLPPVCFDSLQLTSFLECGVLLAGYVSGSCPYMIAETARLGAPGRPQ